TLGEEFSRQLPLRAAHEARHFLRIVPMPAPAQAIARGVMRKGIRIGRRVLERLAQRELEMHPVVIRDIPTRERLAHGVHIFLAEAESLEISQAPPGF